MSRPQVDADDDFPRASSLIADPAGIGLPMAVLFSAMALVDQTVGIGGRWDEGGSWWNIAGVVTALLVTFATLGLAKLVYLRRQLARRHTSIMVLTMLVCVVAGTIAGRALTSALVGPDYPGPTPIGLDRMLFGTALLVIIAWGVGALREYRTAVSELEAVQQQLTMATAVSQEALRAERENVIAPIVATLRDLLGSLPGLSSSDAAGRIREVADNIVRPVSHELIRSTASVELPTSAPLPRSSWRRTLAQVAVTPLLLPKLMAVTMVLFVSRLSINEASGTPSIPRSPEVAVTVDLASLVRALGQLVVVFVVVWLTASIAARGLRRVLPPRTPTARWLITLGSVPVVAVIAQALILAAYTTLGLSPDTQSVLRNPLLFIVPMVVIAMFAAVVRTARTRGSDVLQQLRDANRDLAFEVARLNEELWMQRRSLSKTLHGPVQGTLNAAALIMSQEASAHDNDHARADVTARLSRATEALEAARPERINVAQELTLIAANWQGIIEVDVDVVPDTLQRIQTDPLCAASFVDIVGEATANAVVHGHAKRIVFHVTEQGTREVLINAVDDGTGVDQRDGGGLGSQLLREACTEWGLSSHDGATRLLAVIPVDGTISNQHTPDPSLR